MKRHVLGWIVILVLIPALAVLAAPNQYSRTWGNGIEARLNALETRVSVLEAKLTTTTTTTQPTTTTTQTTTTTTAATTTTTASGYVPPVGVSVTPATFTAHMADPAGTVFILEDGTYPVNNVTPKSEWQFWARNLHGATFEGGGVRQYAFPYFGTPTTIISGVEFHGLIVRGYVPTVTGHAPIGSDVSGVGWVYADLIVENNGRSGLKFGPNSIVRNVIGRNNGETGISSGAPQGSLVEGVELYGNGTAYPPGSWKTGTGSTGGIKILFGSGAGFTVRNSSAHDNLGPGFWTDFVSVAATFDGNTAVNNDGPGFFLEASRPGPIIVRNCVANGARAWHNIYISGSMLVTVEDCQVSGLGIMVSDDNTTDRSVTDALIRNNTISNLVPGSQGAQSFRNIYDPARIQYRGNHYGPNPVFKWDGSLTWSQWQGVGQDLTGTAS